MSTATMDPPAATPRTGWRQGRGNKSLWGKIAVGIVGILLVCGAVWFWLTSSANHAALAKERDDLQANLATMTSERDNLKNVKIPELEGKLAGLNQDIDGEKGYKAQIASLTQERDKLVDDIEGEKGYKAQIAAAKQTIQKVTDEMVHIDNNLVTLNSQHVKMVGYVKERKEQLPLEQKLATDLLETAKRQHGETVGLRQDKEATVLNLQQANQKIADLEASAGRAWAEVAKIKLELKRAWGAYYAAVAEANRGRGPLARLLGL